MQVRSVDNIQRWVLGCLGGGGLWGWASCFAGVASRGVCVCACVACGAAVGLRARECSLETRGPGARRLRPSCLSRRCGVCVACVLAAGQPIASCCHFPRLRALFKTPFKFLRLSGPPASRNRANNTCSLVLTWLSYSYTKKKKTELQSNPSAIFVGTLLYIKVL